MEPNKEFLKPPEVAPMLGVTPSRVYQLIAAGEIPATRIGGSLRIPRRAWERWLDEHAEKASAALHVRGAD